MTTNQELQVQQKRELEKREEATTPTRVFVPTADIYETKDALTVILEMPGVEKNNGLAPVSWRGSVLGQCN